MPSWQKVARRVRIPLGFLLAVAYIWLAHPTFRSVVTGSCISLIGLLIRAFASGHVTKNEQLTTSGPYAYTRNPLYFGSLILAIGFAVASRSWGIALIAAVMFFAIYIPVIHGEEGFLRSHFPEFDEYAHHVPRLVPRLLPYGHSATAFSWDLYWKHREYNAAIGTAFMIVAMIVKAILIAARQS